MILDLWNFLRGYVIIEVEGFSVERFINLATHKGVYLWDVKRDKHSIRMKVSMKAYQLLDTCAQKTLCNIKVLKEKGLPVLFKQYKKRKVFFLGIFICFMILAALSSYIWEIDIQGNERLTDVQILQALKKEGLSVGRFKWKIHQTDIEYKMIKNHKDIAWISIGIKGTRATVQLTETIPKPSFIDRLTPCDVVAAKDGIIESIAVQSGDVKVATQTSVRRGDVLISGVIPMADETTKLVHASGEILAKVWYKAEAKVPVVTTINKRTGKFIKQYELIFLNREIKLFRKGISFKNYDKMIYKKQLGFGKIFTLPIMFKIYTYYETVPTKLQLDYDTVKRTALLYGMQKIESKMPADTKILDTQVQYEEKNGWMIVKVTLVSLERIDQKKKIENRGQIGNVSNGGENN